MKKEYLRPIIDIKSIFLSEILMDSKNPGAGTEGDAGTETNAPARLYM